ncbi:translation initiation factor IF-2-like [Panicum virgatum]|uniref:translation initiation factor IF-2-like n=1 Tax=Panicum virgatum TaxID=38727 RepID=UPI0019D54CA1|nr:translation initiation factor IF-2-like [Panicum virgatum]
MPSSLTAAAEEGRGSAPPKAPAPAAPSRLSLAARPRSPARSASSAAAARSSRAATGYAAALADACARGHAAPGRTRRPRAAVPPAQRQSKLQGGGAGRAGGGAGEDARRQGQGRAGRRGPGRVRRHPGVGSRRPSSWCMRGTWLFLRPGRRSLCCSGQGSVLEAAAQVWRSHQS